MMKSHLKNLIVLFGLGFIICGSISFAAITPLNTLKGYFITGAVPTQSQFYELIDSTFIGTSTAGYMLQTTGTSSAWVATSTLGLLSFSTTSADSWYGTKAIVATTTSNTWADTQTFANARVNTKLYLNGTATYLNSDGSSINIYGDIVSVSPTISTIITSNISASKNINLIGKLAIGTTTTPTNSILMASSTGTSTLQMVSSSTRSSQICWWNGANYTIESYPSNSVTKTVATSTTCN